MRIRRNIMPLKNFKIQPKFKNPSSHKLISTIDPNHTKNASKKQILEKSGVEMVEEENEQISSDNELSGTSIIDFLLESESFEQDFTSKTPDERSWRDVNNKTVHKFHRPKFILNSRLLNFDYQGPECGDLNDSGCDISHSVVKDAVNFTQIHLFSANRLCSNSRSHKVIRSFDVYNAEEGKRSQIFKDMFLIFFNFFFQFFN